MAFNVPKNIAVRNEVYKSISKIKFEMITDDNLLCCLLPNKCNLYGRPLLIYIFNTIFYSINFLIAIYTLMTAAYSLWQIWSQYVKNILSDLMCKNEDCISNISIGSGKFTNINDSFDIIDSSPYQSHQCVVSNCEHTIHKKSFKCQNTKLKSESKPSKCTLLKTTKDHCSTIISSNQKKEIEDIPSRHTIKLKYSALCTNTENERFCVATHENEHSIKNGTSSISICNNSCWPLIKTAYNTK